MLTTVQKNGFSSRSSPENLLPIIFSKIVSAYSINGKGYPWTKHLLYILNSCFLIDIFVFLEI